MSQIPKEIDVAGIELDHFERDIRTVTLEAAIEHGLPPKNPLESSHPTAGSVECEHWESCHGIYLKVRHWNVPRAPGRSGKTGMIFFIPWGTLSQIAEGEAYPVFPVQKDWMAR